MAEFPALPLFTDSYMADTGHLTDAEHGRYLMLLMLVWRAPQCRIPNEPAWICRRLRKDVSAYETEVKPIIDEFFHSTGNWLIQKRLLHEFEYVRKHSKKQSARAKSRWQKEKDACRDDATAGNAPTPTPTPTLISKDMREEGRPSSGALGSDTEQSVVRAWNALATDIEIAQVQHLTPTRRKKLAARLGDIGGLQGWYAVCDEVRQSRFLRGGNDRGWRITFDWILSPNNITKLMEGTYRDRSTGGSNATQRAFADERERILSRAADVEDRSDDHE